MNNNIGSNFDDFLKEEGLYDEVQAVAIKKVLAYQVQKELEKKCMTKLELAKKMCTSRSSLDRLLDPENTSITLKTLVKIAHVLGKEIKLSIKTKNM